MTQIKIPFSILPPPKLYKASRPLRGVAERLEKHMPFLEIHLKQIESKYSSTDYISMCLFSSIIMLIGLTFAMLPAIRFGAPLYFPIIVSIVVTLFMFMQQLVYPNFLTKKRVRLIERNLLPSLQDMHVELNAGVPLFNILVNISDGDYGEVSREMSAVVKRINAGESQVDALENLAVKNPSVLFRRAIWQVVNGMKAGADISMLIKDVIDSISDEQLTQVQKYGGQLSPLALFYMLIAVIAPSLGTTFVIVLSSFISLSDTTIKAVFYTLLFMTTFFQFMFMGMIKSRRPALVDYD